MKWLLSIITAVLMAGSLTTDARANIVTPLDDIEVLRTNIVVPEADFEAWLERYDWTWHQLARREYPLGLKDLDELQLRVICEDPVLWCQTFLREPTDPNLKEPYNFFEYQKPSIRYAGSSIHEDGAEVGKTREIVAWGLWKAYTTQGGSGLTGAPLSIYLLEIVDACTEQFDASPVLARGLKKHDKTPYHRFLFANRFKWDFRPSNFDGAPYRGVHAQTFAMKDEAAKDKNPKTWSEFWRAMKPSCVGRIYSVPDGDRETEYYRLCMSSPLFGSAAPSQVEVEAESGSTLKKFKKNLNLVKFHWPKTIMPAPYWSEERKQESIELYGGENSPGYQHNVLGIHGDPESAVFPVTQLGPCIKDLPEARTLKIVVRDNEARASITCLSYSKTPATDGGLPACRENVLFTREVSLAALFAKDNEGNSDLRRLIKSSFVAMHGAFFGGADFGYWADDTEIKVFTVIGKVERDVARLHLEHVTYDQQAEALDALDDLYDAGRLTMSWGLDYGNAGTAVGHILVSDRYPDKRFEDRIFGVMFESTTEAVDEDGNQLIDIRTEKPLKKNYKELATDLIVRKQQDREREYPPDPDLVLSYSNHTAKEGSRHRIFSKDADHIVDADRLAKLARIFLVTAGVSNDFACGANVRGRS